MDYKRVIEDFNSGKLDNNSVTLVMDNDGGYWCCAYKGKTEEENEAIADLYKEKYGSPEGYKDIVDVLVAAGIVAEWC